MTVKQIYSIVNSVNEQMTGLSNVEITDLTGLISLGKEVLSSATTTNNWLGTLVDRIGKTVVTNKLYKRGADKYLVDSFEFGCALQRIYVEPMDASENDSFGQVTGDSVDQFVISKPTVKQSLFSNKTTFEVDVTVHDEILKNAFVNEQNMATFISAIFIAVENSLEIKIEGMANMCFANFIAERLVSNADAKGNLTVINLLALYNTTFSKTLTEELAFYDADFLKFACSTISKYVKRIAKPSELFNTEGCIRHTDEGSLMLSVLADFSSNVQTYLESDTYNKELVGLPNYSDVPYWQGTGTDYSLEEISKIHIKTTQGVEVEQTGVVAFMADKDSLGVFYNRRAQRSIPNVKGEYTNYFNKVETGYFNDLSENGIVFVVADTLYTKPVTP
jgi:hypothetical protein